MITKKSKLLIIALSFITIQEVLADGWCDYEIKKEEESPCQTGWGFDQQVIEYCEKAESKIRNACHTNNPNKFEMEAALDKVKNHIDYQGLSLVGPERSAIAKTVAELAVVRAKINDSAAALLKLKEDVSLTMKEVKENSEMIAQAYQASMKKTITSINATEDLSLLFKGKQAVSEHNLSAVSKLAEEHERLIQAQVSIEEAENSLIAAYVELSQETLESLSLKDIKHGTNILSSAIEWQINLQYQIVAITEDIQSAIDQKMTLARIKQREKQIDAATKEKLNTAKNIALQTQYLSEVQATVQQMTKARRSSYMNIAYLGETIEFAKKLKGIQEFCSNSTLQTWQKQGCTRANQYKTNVTRVLGTTTQSSITFATRAFSQSDDIEVISLNEQLKQRLLSKDIEGSVILHDLILKKLEVSNG